MKDGEENKREKWKERERMEGEGLCRKKSHKLTPPCDARRREKVGALSSAVFAYFIRSAGIPSISLLYHGVYSLGRDCGSELTFITTNHKTTACWAQPILVPRISSCARNLNCTESVGGLVNFIT